MIRVVNHTSLHLRSTGRALFARRVIVPRRCYHNDSSVSASYTANCPVLTPLSNSRVGIRSLPAFVSNSESLKMQRTIQMVSWRSFSASTLSPEDIQKRLDDFQELFVEARMCIEDVEESMGTKYFDDDAEAAKEAVDQAVEAFEQLIQEINDPDEKNRILRGNGLKVEQLKGELEYALKGGHDH